MFESITDLSDIAHTANDDTAIKGDVSEEHTLLDDDYDEDGEM